MLYSCHNGSSTEDADLHFIANKTDGIHLFTRHVKETIAWYVFVQFLLVMGAVNTY